VLILVSPLPLLKLSQALARLKSPPYGRNASPEFLRSARDLLPAVLPSLPSDSWPLPRHWVRHGVLSLSAQFRRPRNPLARACPNSGDFTAAERSSAAHSRSPTRSDPPVRSWSHEPDRDTTSRTRTLRPWPACQRPCLLALGPLGQCAIPLCRWCPWPAYQHLPARTRALGRRSNLGRRFLIQRLDSPDTPSRGSFIKETLSLFRINPPSLVFARRPVYSCRLNLGLLNILRIRPNFIFWIPKLVYFISFAYELQIQWFKL
jgi:hypothetical protein